MVWEKDYLQVESQVTLDLLVPPLHCHLFSFLWKSTISQITLRHSGQSFTFSPYYIQIYIKVLVWSVSSFGWHLWSFSISVHITWPHSVLQYSLHNLVFSTIITMSTPYISCLMMYMLIKNMKRQTVYFTLNMHLNQEILFTKLYLKQFLSKFISNLIRSLLEVSAPRLLSKVIIFCFYTLSSY